MKWLAVPLLIALVITVVPSSRGAQASAPRIPATVYPAGAHLSYRPHLSNQQMDCLWGFLCEGNRPNFHFQIEDQLHRLGGWAQFAGIHRHGRTTMAFELFASRYDPGSGPSGTTWATYAFRDLRSAIHVLGYRPDPDAARLLTAATRGGALAELQRLGPTDLLVMARWSGDREIEGITFYDHRSAAARQTAWTSLARQVQIAVSGGT